MASSRRSRSATAEATSGEGASPPPHPPHAAISREEAAWLDSLRPWAAAIPRRLGLDRANAEDAVQVAFLLAVGHWSSFVPPPGLPEKPMRLCWVGVILSRVSSKMRAQRDRIPQFAPIHIEDRNTHVVTASHESEVLSRDLLRALERATTPERWQVWVAYQLEDVAVAELARQKGCPAATIYNLLRLARLDLGAALRREAAVADGPVVSRRHPKTPT